MVDQPKRPLLADGRVVCHIPGRNERLYVPAMQGCEERNISRTEATSFLSEHSFRAVEDQGGRGGLYRRQKDSDFVRDRHCGKKLSGIEAASDARVHLAEPEYADIAPKLQWL